AVKTGYHFLLRVKDKKNNEVQSVAPLIVVDAGTKACTKSGRPLDEEVPFHFEPTDIKIKSWVFDVVEADTGKVVRSYDGTAPLPDKLVWDSRDQQNRKVSTKKEYGYVLRMQDQIGNVWQQAAVIEKTQIKIVSRKGADLAVKVEQILFDFNKAELKPGMFQKLRKVADLFRAHAGSGVTIMIEGHTDESGTEAYNYDLSLKRANMVMRYLVEEEGLASAKMKMKGYGKTQLLTQSRTPDAQALNRRVEITLFFREN
ncbi:OmpA family protein, partial [candidate division FCPU426 bacterium]|nr:OmpA family protein [candidate division FCPU426 bacterium]